LAERGIVLLIQTSILTFCIPIKSRCLSTPLSG
jgi:hypothetical protein